MDVKTRNILVLTLSGVAVTLAVCLGGLRFLMFMEKREKNQPRGPMKMAPTLTGRWENDQGYITFNRNGRDIDGRAAFDGFERSVPGGGKESGVIVCTRSGTGIMQKQDFVFYTLADDEKVHWQDRKFTRREKVTMKYDYEKLWLWDENGRESVYRRKE
jgi:hypothetical protein